MALPRTTFKQPDRPERKPRAWPGLQSFAEVARCDVAIKPNPKAVLLRDKGYRRAVASLPCFNCGVEDYSQAAHADEGKGMGIKSSDDTCYPLCADRIGVVGCHSAIGANAALSRKARREFEQAGAKWARVKLGVIPLTDV